MNKVQLFRQTFKGREDIVAKYWRSKKGSSGYSPLCRNEWKKGICKKPCRTCENADYIPLSDSLVLDHLKGKHILGIYPLLKDNTCNFVACDFDDHQGNKEPLEDARAFYQTCQVQEIPSYTLRSKSGKGYHSYIFFEHPVEAWKARLTTLALLKEAEVIGEDFESSFDRLFPNQNEASGKGLGNLIALPFQGKAAIYKNTLILDPKTEFKEPYDDQWKVLEDIQRVKESRLDRMIEDWDLKREMQSIGSQYSTLEKQSLGQLMGCDFIKWCKEQPESVPEPLWYALISNVISIRPGGYTLCHQLSRGYSKYNARETDAKILHALDASGPHTCQYIQTNGFKCRKQCDVKAPAGLIFKERD